MGMHMTAVLETQKLYRRMTLYLQYECENVPVCPSVNNVLFSIMRLAVAPHRVFMQVLTLFRERHCHATSIFLCFIKHRVLPVRLVLSK